MIEIRYMDDTGGYNLLVDGEITRYAETIQLGTHDMNVHFTPDGKRLFLVEFPSERVVKLHEVPASVSAWREQVMQ